MPRSAAGGSASLARRRNQPHWPPAQPSPEELTLYTTLAAYADALDALPLDLTRSFSDLRELDAVLGAHLSSLTNRLIHLTALVEDTSFSAGERILALKEVAEEARAYKMGGEDKIRVALNTAETIISHTTYIDTLLANLSSVPSLTALLNPPSQSHIAGHLSDGTALAPGSGPGGNNPANVSALAEVVTPHNKRKRPAGWAGQGSGGAGGLSSSTIGLLGGGDKRGGQDGGYAQTGPPAVKKRKPPAQGANVKAKVQANNNPSNTSSASAAAAAAASASTYPISMTGMDEREEHAIGKKTAMKRKTSKEEEDDRRADDSTGNGRARPARARGVNVRGSGGSEEEEDDSEVDSSAGGAGGRRARVTRAPRPGHSNQDTDSHTLAPSTAMGEDTDERRYCFCNNVSYGDMIGCDDDDCEREWFHLGCVGLLKPPQGTWYCDDCAQKRTSRPAKSKKAKLSKTSGAHGGGVLETGSRAKR